MAVFRIRNGKAIKLSVKQVQSERELQSLVEANLPELLEMYFLATEYVTTFGGRIDTLAIDCNGAPVIIEYKKGRNDNVINQALSYLKWLQAQKKEFFEMLVLKKLGNKFAEAISVDWRNPRVICIAESFSKFDIDTVEVIPIRIELFRYRYYDDDMFVLDPVEAGSHKPSRPHKSLASKDAFQKEQTARKSLDDFLARTSPEIRDIFLELRERILGLDESVQEKCTTQYVAYRVARNFAEVHISRNNLKIHLRPVHYDDPRGIVEKVPDSFGWTLDRRVYLRSREDLDYVFSLIEQSYRDVL